LILQAQYQQYSQYNFTGAQMTSKPTFSRGRYEVRASLPVGLLLQSASFTHNPKQSYWHNLGQLQLFYNKEFSSVQRTVFLGNTTDQDEGRNLYLSDLPPTDLHQFHLYGVEWNESEVAFFFDDVYTEPVPLAANKSVESDVRIYLQIGVVLDERKPIEFERIQWKCPALIVDYVRVYERIDSVGQMKNCELQLESTKDEERIRSICDQVMGRSLSNFRAINPQVDVMSTKSTIFLSKKRNPNRM